MPADALRRVAEPETATLTLPDGIELVADLWRPRRTRSPSRPADAPALRPRHRLDPDPGPSGLVRRPRLPRRGSGRARARRQRRRFPPVRARGRGRRGDPGLGRGSAGIGRPRRDLRLQLSGGDAVPGARGCAPRGHEAARCDRAGDGRMGHPRRLGLHRRRLRARRQYRLGLPDGRRTRPGSGATRPPSRRSARRPAARPGADRSQPSPTCSRDTPPTITTSTGSATIPPIGTRSRRPASLRGATSPCPACMSAAGRIFCSTARFGPTKPSAPGRRHSAS
jgi:hypothetical protein